MNRNQPITFENRHTDATPPLALRALMRALEQANVSQIRLRNRNGSEWIVGQRTQAPVPCVQLLHARALWRGLSGGLLGWAEGYLAGDWDSPDLLALTDWAMANEGALEQRFSPRVWHRWLARLAHRRNDNTKRGSRRNIAYHYDLGNAFYREWLDAGMTYSSALFDSPDQPLAAAQENKNRAILDLLQVQPHERVLEIGCGWGGLGEQLLQTQPVSWHGVTLSQEQLSWTQQRLAPFATRAQATLTDYRDLTTQYDRIVSVEMLEAVGEAHWPRYFQTLKRCLKPGGTAVLQVITIDESRFEGYRRGCDFIQRYVFPGGMLPTATAIRQQAEAAGLTLDHRFPFGSHYASTLTHWRQAFNRRWDAIAPLGFDERFRRLWNFYLCYCESGFRHGAIDVQLFRLRH